MAVPPLQILALQGAMQNRGSFLKRLEPLQKKLKGLAEFHADVEAPFPLKALEAGNLPCEADAAGEDATRRTWFHGGNIEDFWEKVRHADLCEWIGYQTSLDLLEKTWAEKDYDGLFGFSQGGEMAVVLTAYLQHCGGRMPRFVICASGGFYPTPTNLEFYPCRALQIPALLLAGERDVVVPKQNTEAFQHLFCSAKLQTHSQAHALPSNSKDCEPLKAFLQRMAEARDST